MNGTTEQELEDQIAAMDQLIDAMRTNRHQLNVELMTLRSPFAVGDLIQWGRYRGRVVAIKEWCLGEPGWAVRRIKKDGTEGAVVEVYNYHQPELVENDGTVDN